jgi:(2Fe-2S) ferredoxin
MTTFANRETLQAYRSSLDAGAAKSAKRLISLCAGSGCGAYGTNKVHDALIAELDRKGLGEKFEIRLTGCHGFCEKGPIMVIHPEGTFYSQLKEEHVADIVDQTLIKGELIQKLIYKDPASKKKINKEEEIPFYKLQKRMVFGNNGLIDPTNITITCRWGVHRLEKALFDDETGGHHRGDQKIRLTRPRRRRLPHRHQMGHLRQARRRPLHHLQRRRGRPRGLHGPQPPGGQPAQRHRKA